MPGAYGERVGRHRLRTSTPPVWCCLHWSDDGLPAGASVAQAWRCRSLPGSAPRRRCLRSPREPVALPPDIHAARMVLAYNGRTTGSAAASVAQAWRCRSLPGSAPRRRCTRSPRGPGAVPPDVRVVHTAVAKTDAPHGRSEAASRRRPSKRRKWGQDRDDEAIQV